MSSKQGVSIILLKGGDIGGFLAAEEDAAVSETGCQSAIGADQ